MKYRRVIIVILSVQAFFAVMFTIQTLSAIIAFPATPIPWQLHELIELAAVVGLLLGSALGLTALRRSVRQHEDAEARLKVATQAFMEVMDERFGEWGLTPAERDVALFAIKGMSTQEIADLRGVSDGTIKAQTNAIYRKAGVTGRPQLISHFIEDLMDIDGAVVSNGT